MQAQDARTIIAARLGRRTDLDDLILLHMYLSQQTLEGLPFIPWFLEWSTIPAISVIAGERLYPVPSNFLREVEEGGTFIGEIGQDATPISRAAHDDVYTSYPQSTRGTPCHYSLYRNFVHLGPVPDKAFNLILNYYRRDKAPAVNEENLWLLHAPDLIIAHTLNDMAMYVVKPELKASFQADLVTATNRLMAAHEAHQHTNRAYVRGGA